VTAYPHRFRSWLAGAGLRKVAAQAGVDRKTARRYVEAAVAAGLARDGGPGQLTDELVGQVAEAVRPVRPGGHGQAWDRLEACRDEIQAQVKQGLTVVKIGMLLERQGVTVPYRTLHRFCAERCGTAVPRRRRCGSRTASRGRSASWLESGDTGSVEV
jgi:hypothetical protein